MPFRSLTPMMACICLALAQTARAQTTTRELSAMTALSHADRLDATASPVPYGGFGVGGALGFRSESPNWLISLTAGGTNAHYTAQQSSVTAREHATNGRFSLEMMRTARLWSKSALAFGLAIDGRGEVLSHDYADPNHTSSDYVSAFATAGVAADWRQAIAGGKANLSLAVPVVGVVHQPYGDSRMEHASATLAAASIANLHGADFSARYETSSASKVGMVAEYRFGGFEYTGGWRMRSVTNTTSLGLVIRFGERK